MKKFLFNLFFHKQALQYSAELFRRKDTEDRLEKERKKYKYLIKMLGEYFDNKDSCPNCTKNKPRCTCHSNHLQRIVEQHRQGIQ